MNHFEAVFHFGLFVISGKGFPGYAAKSNFEKISLARHASISFILYSLVLLSIGKVTLLALSYQTPQLYINIHSFEFYVLLSLPHEVLIFVYEFGIHIFLN